MNTTDRRTTVFETSGLARGPAFVVGLVLSVFGLALFFQAQGTPLSASGFPEAQAEGERMLGFEANAWTAWLTTAAGIALLAGAAQQSVARASSALAGLVLGAASVIALIDGDDVLGLAAANGLTALGWGIAAAILLLNTFTPQVMRSARRRPAASSSAAAAHPHGRSVQATADAQERRSPDTTPTAPHSESSRRHSSWRRRPTAAGRRFAGRS